MFGSRGGSGFGSVRGTTFEGLYFEFDLNLGNRHDFAKKKVQVLSPRKYVCKE